ncbi:hypothetical protein LTR08_000718 [Meristemomyces frigidus]|nr:hypothetical protein LTR08_000718 [Meristemomyces frigidus]
MPTETMYGPIFPPAVALTAESSVMLPTLPAHIAPSATSKAATTFYDLIAHTVATASVPSITEACTACDNIMPGIVPTIPSQTTAAHATPTQATVGGIGVLTTAPTSYHGVWYRQPWTLPATGLLCMYALISAYMLVMLVYTGRLDMKLNWVHHSSGRRRTDNTMIDLWRVDSVVSDRNARLVEVRSRRTRTQTHIPISHAHQSTTTPARARQSEVSVADTMIDFGDETQPGNANDADWYNAAQMQPRGGALVWSTGGSSFQAQRAERGWPHRAEEGGVLPDYGSRIARVSRHDNAEGEGEAARHIRHILGGERYAEQLRAWRLHELQMMQTRMVRAGYF